MKNNFQIFIDMDGCFIDFLGGCMRYFKPEGKTIEKDWPLGEWGDDAVLKSIFGVSGKEFWSHLSEAFWASLPYTVDGKEYIKFISQYNPVILTSPAYRSATGKQMWIRHNLPKYYKDRRYLIGPAKVYVARENALLIDDCDANIENWKNAGGLGILYPRRWNKLHYIVDPLGYVKEGVRLITLRKGAL